MKIVFKKGNYSRGCYISNANGWICSFGIIDFPFVTDPKKTNFREKLFHIGYVTFGIFVVRFMWFGVQFNVWHYQNLGSIYDKIHNFFRVVQKGQRNV